MVRKLKIFYKVPDGSYIKKERTGRTRYLQSKSTGLMRGRKRVPPSQSDKTGTKRVEKYFILVKQSVDRRGHTRKKRVHIRDGFIMGRTSA